MLIVLTLRYSLPRKSMAGVLVLLCLNDDDSLAVILTTRALTMRSFPGETALPGGRMEDVDADISATALREAQEEIGLSLPEGEIRIVNTFSPFLSKNLLFVIPVIAFTNRGAKDLLKTFKANEAEVGAVWSWPLRDFLGLAKPDQSAPNVVRYAYIDVNWLMGAKYRLHEFHHEGMGSPVTGLTADILVATALTAYGVEEPGFERKALKQLSNEEMVKAVLDGKAGLHGDTRSSIRKAKVTEDTSANMAR